MRRLRNLSIILVTGLLFACSPMQVQVGKDFDMASFKTRIVQGTTTQDQVRSWLGEPASVGVNVATDGQQYQEWQYFFGEGNLSDMSGASLKMLQIKFDQQNIVRGYNWTEPRK